jgi:antitoxin ParD1/3/4
MDRKQDEHEAESREARLAWLDAAIAKGLADVEAGRVHPLDEVFDHIEARLKAQLGET